MTNFRQIFCARPNEIEAFNNFGQIGCGKNSTNDETELVRCKWIDVKPPSVRLFLSTDYTGFLFKEEPGTRQIQVIDIYFYNMLEMSWGNCLYLRCESNGTYSLGFNSVVFFFVYLFVEGFYLHGSTKLFFLNFIEIKYNLSVYAVYTDHHDMFTKKGSVLL